MSAIVPVAALHAARRAASLLPSGLRNTLFCLACNHLLHAQSVRDALPELDGTHIALALREEECVFGFEIVGTRIQPSTNGQPDVRIAGTAEDFVALALRMEDPDTLFFQRRLCIEGDTARGLLLKNLLDAFDFDRRAHLESLLGPHMGPQLDGVVQRVHTRLQARRTRSQHDLDALL